MDLSIIVVNWNTCDITCNCLKSIYSANTKLDFEVIVVDNGSNDHSVDVIRQQFPKVILITNNYNRGFAAANNQAIRIAKGRYILLLNSDTLVKDDVLEKVARYADENSDFAVVTCTVLNEDGSFQDTCFTFPSPTNFFLSAFGLDKLFPKSRFFGRVRMSWFDRLHFQEVDVVAGCFMLVRRSAIEQVGLLNEDYFMYAEETDWCYRFRKAGWKIVYAPVGRIVHLEGRSSRMDSERMFLQLQGSILRFVKKHRSFLIYVLSCLLISVHFWIRLFPALLMSVMFHDSPYWRRKRTICFKAAFYSLFGWHRLCAR